VLLSYMDYYNGTRTHLSFGQGCADIARGRARWKHSLLSNPWRSPSPIYPDLISGRDNDAIAPMPRKREAGLTHLELLPKALANLKETFERERREAADAWRSRRASQANSAAPWLSEPHVTPTLVPPQPVQCNSALDSGTEVITRGPLTRLPHDQGLIVRFASSRYSSSMSERNALCT